MLCMAGRHPRRHLISRRIARVTASPADSRNERFCNADDDVPLLTDDADVSFVPSAIAAVT